MRYFIQAVCLVAFITLQGCMLPNINPLAPRKNETTIVEVNVQPPLSVTVYAVRPGVGTSSRRAICRNVSYFAECKLSWSIADPASGVIFQIKPLAYPDCPIVSPESVSDWCYNTDIVYFSEDDVIIINVTYPLQHTNYTTRKKSIQ